MSDVIDREKAMNAVADVRNILEHMDTVYDGDINRVKRAIERILAELPTVEAVPVKHGHWLVNMFFIECSECGEPFPLEPQNYCPNCGARMDEE